MRQLTSLDAQFLALESAETYGHVGGLAIYDPTTAPGGELTVTSMYKLMSERLHLLPPFKWRLVPVPFGLDHPYWIEDPDFDLDFHIRESAVPPPGNDEQIAETVARIFARPLDRNHPLWELYLLYGLEGGRVGMLTKIHHSAVDGVSGAEILSVLLDASPEGRDILPSEEFSNADRAPGQLEMLGRGLLGLPRQPLRALRALPATITNLDEIPGVATIPGASTVSRFASRLLGRSATTADGGILESETVRAPQTRFSSRISPHRRFAFGSVSLDRVKAIKNELGITVNDVVIALCATALRDWLQERDELPDDPLVAMVPVSVRTEEQKGTFGNRVSMMVAPIPTDVAGTRERLMRAHDILKVAKERHKAVPASILQDATQFIPPAVHARASRAVLGLQGLRPPLNVIISNVPGPRDPLYCAGAQLQANFPVSVITDGVGLNITVMSYRDHIDIGIVTDREQVDDAWSILRAMGTALDEIDAEVCGPPEPVAAPEPAAPPLQRLP
ncbi:MAG: diacylglycerol O-acyltransferase / wax synthase [Thermoleophilaceae bacterium]|jgi:WS/DGAT/MGAT family acyltransferase|nr:diacylglycerol O-acyltransferase / wax synthase [Thermoleophilaceae bacterium]